MLTHTQNSECQLSWPRQGPYLISNTLSVCFFTLSLSVSHPCIQGSLHSNGGRRDIPSNSRLPHFFQCQVFYWLVDCLVKRQLTWLYSHYSFTYSLYYSNLWPQLVSETLLINDSSPANLSLSLDTTDYFWKCSLLDFRDHTNIALLPLLLCSLKLLLSLLLSFSSLSLSFCCPSGFQPGPFVFSFCSSSLGLQYNLYSRERAKLVHFCNPCHYGRGNCISSHSPEK